MSVTMMVARGSTQPIQPGSQNAAQNNSAWAALKFCGSIPGQRLTAKMSISNRGSQILRDTRQR